MDRKRMKRQKQVDDGLWDCSVCTYKNSPEAFKCAMCDVRKGTSTRKPKANPQLVAQQVAQQLLPSPPAAPTSTGGTKKDKHPSAHRRVGAPAERERVGGTGEDMTAGETDTSMDSTTETPQHHRVTPASVERQRSETEPKRKVQRPRPGLTDRSPGLTTGPPIVGLSMEVTVGDVTVVITDYKPPTMTKRQKLPDRVPRERMSIDRPADSQPGGDRQGDRQEVREGGGDRDIQREGQGVNRQDRQRVSTDSQNSLDSSLQSSSLTDTGSPPPSLSSSTATTPGTTATSRAD